MMAFRFVGDAHVRAILNPTGCSDEDFAVAETDGLVVSSWQGGIAPDARHLHHRGAAIIAYAERIAEALSEPERELLTVAAHGGSVPLECGGPGFGLHAHGLVDDAGLIRPAGRLVLALHDRMGSTNITDAHVRALLRLDNASNDDVNAAIDAGLVALRWWARDRADGPRRDHPSGG